MKKNIKMILALVLCFVMLFAMVACNTDTGGNTGGNTGGDSGGDTGGDTGGNTGGDTGGGTSSGRDDLIIAITADSGTLDPLYNVGWDLLNALRMVYEPLWEYQGDGTQRFVLAESVDTSNPLHWTIKLRDDATFSNGNPFTADDVIFSLWRANNRVGVTAFIKELDLDQSKAVDDYTVELFFTESSIGHVATFASIFMFDKESFDDATSSTVAIGTGPYVVDQYVTNSHFNLSLRDDYWGTMPSISKLQFRVLSEESQRVNALQTGEVDMATVPFQDVTYVETMDNITVNMFMGNMTNAIFMNTSATRNLFSNMDETARKAVAYAIDRQAIVNIVYSGFAEVSRFPLSAGTTDAEERYFDLGVYGHGYDPDLAKQLAEESGLVNYEITLINNGSSVDTLISELVQTNLMEIGVKVNIQSLDSGSWLTVMFDKTQWDMAIQFTFGDTVGAAYKTWAAGMIAAYHEEPEMWKGSDVALPILADITTIVDTAVLSDLNMQLTEIFVDAMLWFALVDQLTPTAYNSALKGYAPMRSGNIIYTDLSW